MSGPADPAALVSEARALLSALPQMGELIPLDIGLQSSSGSYYPDSVDSPEEFAPTIAVDIGGEAARYERRAVRDLFARAPELLAALADALERTAAEARVRDLRHLADVEIIAERTSERDAALARAERAERKLKKARTLSTKALDAAESAVSSSDRDWALECIRKLHAELGSGEG